ncbi:MAG: ABC transporter ATP-binding protein [Firmicutes bacterium]|nr:ABC transporter ATP-binding protein [Bacillota bacterium]
MIATDFEDQLVIDRATVAYRTFDGHRTALQRLSMNVAAGQWLGVVGANGSGKSTLAQVAAGLLPLSAGAIRYAPNRVKALVMQQPGQQLIGETLREDLYFGMDNAGIPAADRESRLLQALARVGLAGYADRPISQLSGGQQQLGAIAGCIAVNATLLILDEPTSMLSAQARERVLQTIRALCDDGVAVLWITHRLEELAYADTVLALVDGTCAFTGGVSDFFYGSGDSMTPETSPCVSLGFSLPYVPSVVAELAKRGIFLATRPTSPETLASAIGQLRLGVTV